MPEESDREKDYYYIGTEQDYWETYPVLQTYLPEKILEYLASQVAILDSNYGADRDVQGGMGGFCAVIPKLDEAAKKAYRRYWRSIISRNLCMNILIRSRSAAQTG